jgi:hypothetical protein
MSEERKVICSCYNLLTARGDKEKFIKTIAKNGANSIRIFALYTWGMDKENPLMPFKEICKWNAGYNIPKILPFFDMTEDNKDYWDEWWRIHEWIAEYIGHVREVAHDNCSFKKSGYEKYYHPFLSCIQRRDPDDPGKIKIPGGVWGEGMKKWHKFWFKKLVTNLKKLGIPFEIEICNEYDAIDWPDSHMIEWHNWAVQTFIQLGVPRERIIASAMRNPKEISEQVAYYSVHGHSRPEDVKPNYFGIPNEKIEISTDGGFKGKGRADWKGRRGPNCKQAREIAQKAKEYGYTRIEFFDRGIEGKRALVKGQLIANVDLFSSKVLQCFTKEFLDWKPTPKPTKWQCIECNGWFEGKKYEYRRKFPLCEDCYKKLSQPKKKTWWEELLEKLLNLLKSLFDND